LIVRDWRQIRPDVGRIIDLQEVSTAIMIFIILFVATLGVVNTMLMAVFERTRELGMLKAIGMSERRIIWLILTESLLLVLASSLVGILGGLLIDSYLVLKGLDLRNLTAGFSMGGLGIDPVVRGAITQKGLVVPIVLLGVTCLIASIYPALRAARLQPAVGMRET
jgi:ABC-type antimicrobial peptide transport system permease subunit